MIFYIYINWNSFLIELNEKLIKRVGIQCYNVTKISPKNDDSLINVKKLFFIR